MTKDGELTGMPRRQNPLVILTGVGCSGFCLLVLVEYWLMAVVILVARSGF